MSLPEFPYCRSYFVHNIYPFYWKKESTPIIQQFWQKQLWRKAGRIHHTEFPEVILLLFGVLAILFHYLYQPRDARISSECVAISQKKREMDWEFVIDDSLRSNFTVPWLACWSIQTLCTCWCACSLTNLSAAIYIYSNTIVLPIVHFVRIRDYKNQTLW